MGIIGGFGQASPAIRALKLKEQHQGNLSRSPAEQYYELMGPVTSCNLQLFPLGLDARRSVAASGRHLEPSPRLDAKTKHIVGNWGDEDETPGLFVTIRRQGEALWLATQGSVITCPYWGHKSGFLADPPGESLHVCFQ